MRACERACVCVYARAMSLATRLLERLAALPSLTHSLVPNTTRGCVRSGGHCVMHSFDAIATCLDDGTGTCKKMRCVRSASLPQHASSPSPSREASPTPMYPSRMSACVRVCLLSCRLIVCLPAGLQQQRDYVCCFHQPLPLFFCCAGRVTGHLLPNQPAYVRPPVALYTRPTNIVLLCAARGVTSERQETTAA